MIAVHALHHPCTRVSGTRNLPKSCTRIHTFPAEPFATTLHYYHRLVRRFDCRKKVCTATCTASRVVIGIDDALERMSSSSIGFWFGRHRWLETLEIETGVNLSANARRVEPAKQASKSISWRSPVQSAPKHGGHAEGSLPRYLGTGGIRRFILGFENS